jgi:hypothetical protein
MSENIAPSTDCRSLHIRNAKATPTDTSSACRSSRQLARSLSRMELTATPKALLVNNDEDNPSPRCQHDAAIHVFSASLLNEKRGLKAFLRNCPVQPIQVQKGAVCDEY